MKLNPRTGSDFDVRRTANSDRLGDSDATVRPATNPDLNVPSRGQQIQIASTTGSAGAGTREREVAGRGIGGERVGRSPCEPPNAELPPDTSRAATGQIG